MSVKCAQCGKEFHVLYPDLYVYKRGIKFFCKYSCMRAFDKKHEKGERKMKVTNDVKKAAIQIAIDGGDPREYLAEHGSVNPTTLWWSIRAKLKDEDPETFARLPGRLPNKQAETPEDPVKAMPKPAAEAVEVPEKTVYAVCERPKITKPVNYGGYEVTAIRHPELGEFYYDKKFSSIDWRTIEGDEISMGPAGWKKLLEELPKMLNVLGVEV